MKIYIATLIEKNENNLLLIQTHAATTPGALMRKVIDAIEDEKFERGIHIPYEPLDILMECERGNQLDGSEPLSFGWDDDLLNEFLLSTNIIDLPPVINWEEALEIRNITNSGIPQTRPGIQPFYEEVARRFNERKSNT